MIERIKAISAPRVLNSVDRSVVKQALADSLPLYLPAIPFALVIGLTIENSGINPWTGWAASWIIFGGAAQITLIALLGSGATIAAAATAAIVVNGRHLMYSAALAPHFQNQPRWFRWAGPYLLLDQVFVLSSTRQHGDPRSFRTYYLTSGIMFWTLWQINVIVGLFLGPSIPEEWNIEFTVAVMFIGIVVMGIDRFPKFVAALVAAMVTYLCAGLPNQSGLLVGALAGILVGVLAEGASARE